MTEHTPPMTRPVGVRAQMVDGEIFRLFLGVEIQRTQRPSYDVSLMYVDVESKPGAAVHILARAMRATDGVAAEDNHAGGPRERSAPPPSAACLARQAQGFGLTKDVTSAHTAHELFNVRAVSSVNFADTLRFQ
jgi:hypothetical protein